MIGRIRFCRSVACAIVLAALIPAERLTAQFNDVQGFDGTVGSEFAVPPGSVPYWSTDGGCSPAMLFQDWTRGDNGSMCLRSLHPVGVGTRMIRDLNPGAGSSTIGDMGVSGFAVIWRLWVSADDGSGTNGQEFYRIVDSLYGIMLLELDINPGAASSTPQDLFQHVPGRSLYLYFSADDGTNGRELWRCRTTNGLSTATTMAMDINPGASSSNPSGFAVVGSGDIRAVVFAADDGTNGRELWRTYPDPDDPILQITQMVTDINTTSAGASSDPQLMTSIIISTMGGFWDVRAFFTADDGVNGRELWRSDGTGAGTGLVMDIVAGATGSNPTNLTAVTLLVSSAETPTLLFTVDSDGANGQELWKSRGALDGSDTEQVYDPGAAGSPANLTAVNDLNLLFFTLGNDLWKSDGTTAGTVSVKTFASTPTNLVGAGSALYFVADDGTGSGVELWTSDGTTTSMVKDIQTGAGSSSPQNLFAIGGTVYFSADDGANGRELWRSDSTAGALLVMDINPGAASSNPSNLNNFDGTLMFTADDGTHGVELWQSDGFPVPDHVGMSYKWDLASNIQAKTGNPTKIAVAAADTNVMSVYWLHDFPAMGGVGGLSEAAHQVNTYVELTDGTDRAPLTVTNVDCGDGNLTRPKAALTDGSNHNAIAFGMVAVLDQNPCDTDPRGGGSPGVPFAHVPAVYDGHDWIPMRLANFPPGVPTTPPTEQVLGQSGPETGWPGYIGVGPTLPADLVAATEDPWQQKRFAWARIDVWTDYITVLWGNKQGDTVWVATIERKYKGAFKSLYFGNKACLQPAYPFYLDSVYLNGGIFTTGAEPFGACCQSATDTCVDGLSEAECVGTYTPWLDCSDPETPLCCPTPWADTDNDDDVDQADFGLWQVCFTGDDGGINPGCECYDRNDSTGAQGGDGNDIDATDFTWFENCFTGPAVPLDVENPPAGCVP